MHTRGNNALEKKQLADLTTAIDRAKSREETISATLDRGTSNVSIMSAITSSAGESHATTPASPAVVQSAVEPSTTTQPSAQNQGEPTITTVTITNTVASFYINQASVTASLSQGQTQLLWTFTFARPPPEQSTMETFVINSVSIVPGQPTVEVPVSVGIQGRTVISANETPAVTLFLTETTVTIPQASLTASYLNAVPGSTGASIVTGSHTTTTTTATTLPSSKPTSKGMSTGVIAGITVAGAIVLAFAIAACIFCRRRKNRARSPDTIRLNLLGQAANVGYDGERGLNKMPNAAFTSVPPKPVRKSILFDQPKDDDAMKTLFENADETLADHVENYYVPKNDIAEAKVAQQMKQIPPDQNSRIQSSHILSGGSRLLSSEKTRGYAIRALAAYFLYDAVMSSGFLPKDLKRQLEAIKKPTKGRRSSQSAVATEKRLVAFHMFAQGSGYDSAMQTSISHMTKLLDAILSPFAIDSTQNTERQANLQHVVRRFAELAVTLGKQPTIFKAELLTRDFNNTEVPRAERASNAIVVRYVGKPFDEKKMEVENGDPGDNSRGLVRAVIAPGVMKEAEHGSQLLRKAKVIVL